MEYLLIAAGVLVGAFLFFRFGVRRVTVLEYERGLRYAGGRFRGVLGAGIYWYVPFRTLIRKLDVRPRFVSITGQEILTADGVSLKLSLAANYEISAPDVATNAVQSFEQALYLELQLALREIVSAIDIDSLLERREKLSEQLMEKTASKAEQIGLRLVSVNLKDIMFPGKLKEVFARVVNARKEGLAALEKARGETAALRNLANAARMVESNPNLMQLRLVQALESSSGNTLVLGMPPQGTPLPVRVGTPDAADPPKAPPHETDGD